MLASFSAVSCMARATIGQVHSNPDAYATVVKAAEEAAASDARSASTCLPTWSNVVFTQIKDMPKDGRPSMLEDLEAGRRLELPWLSGAVVRLGAKAEVPTPIHCARQCAAFDPRARQRHEQQRDVALTRHCRGSY